MSLQATADSGRLTIGGVICHADGTYKAPLILSAEVPEQSRRRFYLPAVLQHNNAARTVLADALVDLFDVGSTNAEGRIKFYTEGFIDLLATVPMANPAFDNAVTGVASGLNLPWSDPLASGDGYASEFIAVDRDENTVLVGAVGIADAEITFQNPEIAVNDIVKILTCSYTAPP